MPLITYLDCDARACPPHRCRSHQTSQPAARYGNIHRLRRRFNILGSRAFADSCSCDYGSGTVGYGHQGTWGGPCVGVLATKLAVHSNRRAQLHRMHHCTVRSCVSGCSPQHAALSPCSRLSCVASDVARCAAADDDSAQMYVVHVQGPMLAASPPAAPYTIFVFTAWAHALNAWE
jgi:hypothetical protein